MATRDVIVVGAGPAGSVSALLLARAGYDVELYDRAEFPRAKPCGDCVSPGANVIFRSLGVWQDIESAGAARLRGWTVRANAHAACTAHFAQGSSNGDAHYSFALPRHQLDNILVKAARAAGVTLRTGALVTSLWRDSDGALNIAGMQHAEPFRARARLVIGADGLRSRIARLLGAHQRRPGLRKLSLTAHVPIAGCSDLGEIHIAHGACLGIAPVQNGVDSICNLTTVINSAELPAERGPQQLMRTVLHRFDRQQLADLITDDVEILACGPFDWPTRRIVFDGVALVGDAAGYYDPFTGQGIFQALAGAQLLAEHVAGVLQSQAVTKSALSAYALAHRSLVRSSRRVQRAIEFVCARPSLAERVITGLSHAPDMAARLIAVTGDVRPARDLLSPRTLATLLRAVALHPAA